MFNMVKKIILVIFVYSCAYSEEVGIVDTNILLIKKHPSDNSARLGFYKTNTVINIESTTEGIDDEQKWYKTKRGYVKARYVILEKDLPKFISADEIDYNKNAIQLIVYQNTVVQSLQKLRKILINEKNIYLEKVKNVYVIYLANFSSYKEANKKRDEILKYFSSAYITKIKDRRTDKQRENSLILKNNIDKVNEPIKKEALVVKDKEIKKVKVIQKENLKFKEANKYSNNANEMISKEELDALKNDIEEIKINKPKKRVQSIQKDVIKIEKVVVVPIKKDIIKVEQTTVKPIKKDKIIVNKKETKEPTTQAQSYQSILENLLIFINKK